MNDSRKPAATAYTTAVVLASALARDDLQWLHRRTLRHFEFHLLAAATQATPTPPAAGWYDLKRLLRIDVTILDSELRLSLQAEGFSALQITAGRSGRLVSRDHVIDVQLRFDTAGHALVVLANDSQVKNALQQLDLMLEDRLERFE